MHACMHMHICLRIRACAYSCVSVYICMLFFCMHVPMWIHVSSIRLQLFATRLFVFSKAVARYTRHTRHTRKRKTTERKGVLCTLIVFQHLLYEECTSIHRPAWGACAVSTRPLQPARRKHFLSPISCAARYCLRPPRPFSLSPVADLCYTDGPNVRTASASDTVTFTPLFVLPSPLQPSSFFNVLEHPGFGAVTPLRFGFFGEYSNLKYYHILHSKLSVG